ncbi:MAG: V-type ATP synthase subunit I [Candidatus Nanohaloarchaeota archaeon QJJ-7]|nr:V-type ATP synthase subunit I [Candidatus Nanohaloarchaeota archaeon QJJ-7]
MIRPKEMVKVSILGPKSKMNTVVERLHDLEVLHLDEYEEEEEGMDIGGPGEEAEELSDQLVKVRSIKSKLPEVEEIKEEQEEELDDIGERIEEIEQELDRIEGMKAEREDLIEKLQVVEDLGLELEDFREYTNLDIYLGSVKDTGFEEELADGRYELYRSGDTVALFADRELEVEELLRESEFDSIGYDDLVEKDGGLQEVLTEVETDLRNLEEREEELRDELEELGSRWRHHLENREEELSEDLEKAEAPLSFATTESSFIAEGWIPEEKYDEVVEELENATQGNIHIERYEEETEAPIEHDNPAAVRPVESLVKLYGTPSYSEVDPTFLLMMFPVLFGFMLGDVGYGITTFAVFYLMYRKFPDAKGLWFSLMYASVATVAFGLVYAEMFGYIIFGHHSVLAEITGIHLFKEIPILFHRAEHVGMVMEMSVLIGIAHVNFGFLVGAYNEYISHGLLEAVFAKLSWLVIQAGAVIIALTGMTYAGAGIMVAGVAMLYRGESVEGVVEIPSLLSNILSYLRVFGVIMAVLALAAVVNSMAEPLFQSGSLFMVGMGVLVLVVGHTFNTFLKMMEAGLQGIRLHYVEFFTKFFEGGGEYYRPFGGENV